MKTSTKFNRYAAAGLAGLAVTLAGCGPAQTPEQEKNNVVVIPAACRVVDLAPPGRKGYEHDTYDFRFDVVIFSSDNHGYTRNDSVAMPMKELGEDGRARAREMFIQLPASANCKPPKFN